MDRPGRRALEIGCGSGQATRTIAERGIPLVCIEPGPNLAELARRNLARFENVRVVCSSFEQWPFEVEPFDLVFSANAIHWVHPRARTLKTAQTPGARRDVCNPYHSPRRKAKLFVPHAARRVLLESTIPRMARHPHHRHTA